MSHSVQSNQLQVGVYVMLEEHWLRHPFLFNDFIIKDEAMLKKIQALHLGEIRWDPEKSKVEPLKVDQVVVVDNEETEEELRKAAEELEKQLAEKKERIRKAKERSLARAKAEKAYEDASKDGESALDKILVDPSAAKEEIENIAQEVTKWLNDEEAALHMLNSGKLGNESLAHAQAMGVMTISALIATSMGFEEDMVIKIAAGGLMHDVGRERVGEAIWRKPDARRITAERNVFKMHSEWGAAQVEKMEVFSKEVINCVRYHHERADGSGFPKGFRGDDIPMEAKVVGLAEHYYQMCHPYDGSLGIQPFQALAKIFKEDSRKFDIEVISALVRGLGVYPPGTLVELSNGQFGLVCMHKRGVKESTLRPTIEVYDPHVPKQEILLINLLEEDEVSIKKALTPDMLPREALEYLLPKYQLIYMKEKAEKKAG